MLPAAQLLPVLVEVTVLTRLLSPASGLFTVAEKVIVTVAPTARLPVQVRFGLVYETLPADGDASAVIVAHRLEEQFDLGSMTVGILGMAFKASSDDIRSSLSYKLKRIPWSSRPARSCAPILT